MSEAELDDLVREIDRLCDRGDWEALVALRDRCRAALERGKQLWPAASFAEYRLALEAPGRWAAQVVAEPGAGRFALGPLPEVASCRHAWDDLAAAARSGAPALSIAAHERVVRGEDLDGDARVDPGVLDLPLALQGWEPDYPVAEYHPGKADFPAPALPELEPVRLAPQRRLVEDPESVRALVDLAGAWTTESNGRAEAVAVQGDAPGALAALGVPRARMAELGLADALAHMAWTAASGGAHGRRRGMAAGRFAAWWALAAVAGLAEDWPVPAAELGEAGGELRWYLWDAGEPVTGWGLRLAVEDPAEGLAWALVAQDAA